MNHPADDPVAVAPLGLGASLVLTQHNDVIGALGHYCGIEVTEQAEAILGDACPGSWEKFCLDAQARTQNDSW